MYKKCENCYKDGKVPNEESCKKCEDDLKRKEQECEVLKENYKNAMTSLDAFMRSCADLRCKKLNIEKKYKKEICKQQKSIVKLKTENEHLSEKEEEARHYLKEAEKFKNCLTDIKEIAENRGTYPCSKCIAKEILQKISECEEK